MLRDLGLALVRIWTPYPAGELSWWGAGKAAAAMAQTVERHMPLDMTGLVIVPDRYAVCCERIEVVEASHPFQMRGARVLRNGL